MKETVSLLFALLRTAMTDAPLSDTQKAACTEQQLQQLQQLAHKHDMAHLLALGLQKNGIALTEALRKSILTAAFRVQKLTAELNRLSQALEAAQIPFLPLKGSVLRQLYPEPWMRTSCDIDVLVPPENLEKAQNCLVETCGYQPDGGYTHDVSMNSPSGVHLELHFDLIEASVHSQARAILQDIWQVVQPAQGWQYRMEMPDEYFYFYHVIHMAKHFSGGGCGIRPFVDLWLLDKQESPKRDMLLEHGGLLKFAGQARKLSRHWLSQQETDPVLAALEEYVLTGGIYGTMENRIAVQQQIKGSKFRYILRRIFHPYDELKYQYPILQKHRWLMPVMQVRRWFRLLFKGKFKKTMNELKMNQNVTEAQQSATAQLLKDIGL